MTPADRPRLAPFVRVRRDRISGKTVLLMPERGLWLGDSARAIVELCTGEHSMGAILDALARVYPGVQRERLVREVSAFLEQLEARGVLELEAG